MQKTKSYMLPKLIVLNMLALMMITFEHEVPADNHLLLSSNQSGPEVAIKSEASPVLVADNTAATAVNVADADDNKQTAMKKPAVYKKRVSQKHSAIKPNTMVLKASYTANTPLGCCFRGNRI